MPIIDTCFSPGVTRAEREREGSFSPEACLFLFQRRGLISILRCESHINSDDISRDLSHAPWGKKKVGKMDKLEERRWGDGGAPGSEVQASKAVKG